MSIDNVPASMPGLSLGSGATIASTTDQVLVPEVTFRWLEPEDQPGKQWDSSGRGDEDEPTGQRDAAAGKGRAGVAEGQRKAPVCSAGQGAWGMQLADDHRKDWPRDSA